MTLKIQKPRIAREIAMIKDKVEQGSSENDSKNWQITALLQS
jgi:hypothetical protein